MPCDNIKCLPLFFIGFVMPNTVSNKNYPHIVAEEFIFQSAIRERHPTVL